jgi:ATP-binding cassette subfamily F protein uup
MSPLITCKDITKSFGAKELFSHISVSLFAGDRLGVIGPNGSGKSTWLKILAQELTEDGGEVARRRGLKVGYVPQISSMPQKSVLEAALSVENDEVIAKTLLSQIGFENFDQPAQELSGGWQKKLDLVRALMPSPDILFLDEPTNHLDLESIVWLENFLLKNVATFVVTSHDRRFLERVTNRMLEINRAFPKGVFETAGRYSEFIEQREVFLQSQLEYQRSLSSKVRREQAWLKTTPQARTTKSKSRIDAAEMLIEELSQVKSRTARKKLSIDFSSTQRETKKLLSAKNLSKSLGGRLLFSKLDILLSPGTRIGLIGPNGSGKSTLLKMLALEIPPDQGTIKLADGLKIVYFDQMRAQLPLHLTLKEALCPSGEYVTFRGRPLHVNSWAKKFFFPPNLLVLPLSELSGGERARLIIARLMLQEADILLLDEPTNDLDIDTLEVIEENLDTFPGAIVLITHDREMMERVAQETIALSCPPPRPPSPPPQPEKQTRSSRALKLSYKDKYEYASLTEKIEALEQDIASLNRELCNPEISLDHERLDTLGRALKEKEEVLDAALKRWLELDSLLA